MKKRFFISVMLMLAVLISATVSSADDLPELKFEKFELPNGLDVILHEDHSWPWRHRWADY